MLISRNFGGDEKRKRFAKNLGDNRHRLASGSKVSTNPVSRRGEQTRRAKRVRGRGSARGHEHRPRTISRQRTGTGEGGESFLRAKRPVLRFVLVLVVLMVAFNVSFLYWISEGRFFEGYLALNADAGAAILNAFGENARAMGTHLSSSRYALDIKRGCDGLQASVFFAIAVIASPCGVAMLARLPVIIVGTSFLLVFNLVRIVSLYYTGIYFPDLFDIMHVDVWQPVFIFLPLFLWAMWARSVERRSTVRSHADT